MHVYTEDKKEVLTFQRPYAFCFPSIEIYEGEKLLGKVQNRFSCCSKEFSVLDENDQEIFHISGPFCCYWTFNILQNGESKSKNFFFKFYFFFRSWID